MSALQQCSLHIPAPGEWSGEIADGRIAQKEWEKDVPHGTVPAVSLSLSHGNRYCGHRAGQRLVVDALPRRDFAAVAVSSASRTPQSTGRQKRGSEQQTRGKE